MNNAQEIARFVSFQSTLSKSRNTLKKYSARLGAFNHFLGKPWREANRDDIAHALVAMQESGLKQNTLRDSKIVLRLFYRWLYELPKGELPACVAWVEPGQEESKHVERDDLITAEDLRRLLEATPHARNKALIAVLWATGVRAGELLSLRIKDLETVEGVYGLNVNGTKTAYSRRWAAVADETVLDLLQTWIKSHPQAGNPNAFLWVKESGLRFSQRHLADVLEESHRRAGVIKPANPHHYRHSWASLTARKQLPYESFCRMGGWALSSRVPARYLHNDKHDDAKAVALSLTDEREKEGLLLREISRLLHEFIAQPANLERWDAFIAGKQQRPVLQQLAAKIVPRYVGALQKIASAPADTRKRLQCSNIKLKKKRQREEVMKENLPPRYH